MFKEFLKETQWLLIIVFGVSLALGGTALHTIKKNYDIKEDTKGIPDQIWEIREYEEKKGLKFTKLSETLYSMTGTVRKDDCKKIVPQLPNEMPFAVILESPGGDLAEGACLASHLKLRNVITVVRASRVLDENGKVLYEPGLVNTDPNEKRVMCASSCSLLFLAGDIRYLIGDVWLGIHAPRTPEEYINSMGRQALEANAYRTSAALMGLLKNLGLSSEKVRLMFLQVPSSSMYWINVKDWKEMPELMLMATHYVNFWGFSGENVLAGKE
jgi:hypothetical protein